jgi:hypothetical protein
VAEGKKPASERALRPANKLVESKAGKLLALLLMAILSKTFLTFVCGDLMPLSFLTTRHTTMIF